MLPSPASARRIPVGLAWLLAASGTAAAAPAPADASAPVSGPEEAPLELEADEADAETEPETGLRRPRAEGRQRRFMIGLEGVALLTPSIQPLIIDLDRRYVGPTTTLGGAGIFGRWRAVPWLGLDLGVRSGSLRLRRVDSGDIVSQDLILAEVGALLYLARGEIGQLAIDGGVGGLAHQIGYALGDGGRTGTQRVGAALFRVGVDIELLLTRVAFVISLRAYGVITDRRRTAVKGALFEGIDAAGRAAPVPTYQTYVIGAAGLAYRF